MTNFRISYSVDLKHWRIQPAQGGNKVIAARVVLDAPAKTNGPFLEVKDCELKTNNVIQLEDRTVIETAFLRRNNALPGSPPKHDPQLEWCSLFDPNSDKWVIFRQDNHAVVVTTNNLEMDCHAITSKGVWHSHAQQLVNGTSNEDKAVMDAKWVKLRTLRVFDQARKVELIKLKTVIKPPVRVQ